jgi:hypothetical protein
MPTTAPVSASTRGPPEDPEVGRMLVRMYGKVEDVPAWIARDGSISLHLAGCANVPDTENPPRPLVRRKNDIPASHPFPTVSTLYRPTTRSVAPLPPRQRTLAEGGHACRLDVKSTGG